ncbi:hypothetical protein Pelo_10511 [Pelomyxa schiedti]|nr:hypothetical protein Pelo_10511 [Pelomyxa schiedti]
MYHLRVFHGRQNKEEACVSVSQSSSVSDLKVILYDKLGYPPESQRLVWCGRVLKEGVLHEVAPQLADEAPVYLVYKQAPVRRAAVGVTMFATKERRVIPAERLRVLVQEVVPAAPSGGGDDGSPAVLCSVSTCVSSTPIPLSTSVVNLAQSDVSPAVCGNDDLVSCMKETTSLLDTLKERMAHLISSVESSRQTDPSPPPNGSSPAGMELDHEAKDLTPLLQHTAFLLGILGNVLGKTPPSASKTPPITTTSATAESSS